MKWTVVWLKGAESDLAAIWNAGPDRQAVADASNSIDSLLQRDPENLGESRLGDDRVVVVDPLLVQFHVSNDDCLVSVFDVRRSASAHGGP